MELFILKTRAELFKIWDDCLYGEQQKEEFPPAFVEGMFSDDILFDQEDELVKMRKFYKDNEEILKLIKKRDEMFQQYCALEVCVHVE